MCLIFYSKLVNLFYEYQRKETVVKKRSPTFVNEITIGCKIYLKTTKIANNKWSLFRSLNKLVTNFYALVIKILVTKDEILSGVNIFLKNILG